MCVGRTGRRTSLTISRRTSTGSSSKFKGSVRVVTRSQPRSLLLKYSEMMELLWSSSVPETASLA